MRRRPSTAASAVVLLLGLLGLGACTTGPDDPRPTASPSPTPTPTALSAQVSVPTAAATVLPAATPDDAALEVSRTLYASAPVVVLAPVDDIAAQLTAATVAVALGTPALLVDPAATPGAVTDELARLGTEVIVRVGAVALTPPVGVSEVPVAPGAGADLLEAVTGQQVGAAVEVAPGQETAAVRGLVTSRPALLLAAGIETPTPSSSPAPSGSQAPSGSPSPSAMALPRTGRPTPPAGTVALTGVGADSVLALATIRAAGVDIVDTPGGDPRATTPGVEALAATTPDHVIALGAAFGDPEQLAARTAVARTGVLIGGGGQLVFPQVTGLPGKRYIALYGTPGSASLGVLGEQDVPATIARAQATAAPYQPLTPDTIVPAVEIIATIASGGPEPDGSYSRKRTVDELRPLVEAAGAAGMAVVLDLQPGRQDFVTQAQLYADLLSLPYVGLALDPEWRLAPDQVHLRQIGSVGIDEVNATIAWLADFTAQRHLPQKMLVLHQFASRMIVDRPRLDTSRDELALVIHVDGQGGQPDKAGTWNAIRADAPAVHWGWKNFYDEDVPMLDPTQTFQVQPTPDLVSYQ